MEKPGRIKSLRRWLAAGLLAAATGCTAPPHLLLPGATTSDLPLPAALAAHPLAPGDNFTAALLGRTESFSYHLVQIRDRERPHLHATHDAAVTLLRGKGRLYIAGQPHEMRVGDVAVIHHGTPHYFVNTSGEPAVAFATFVPPYDGTDLVPVE